MNYLARIISITFHPLIMPTLGLFIIFYSGLNFTFFTYEQKRAIFLVVFLSTYAVPLSFMPLFLFKKTLFHIDMTSSKDRLIPFFLTSAIYFIAFYFMRKIGIPGFILNFIFSSALAVLFATIITSFWKISVHMIGIGGITGLLLYLSVQFNADVFPMITSALLFTGLIGSSRLILNSHKPSQVYAGFFLGMAIMFTTLFILP